MWSFSSISRVPYSTGMSLNVSWTQYLIRFFRTFKKWLAPVSTQSFHCPCFLMSKQQDAEFSCVLLKVLQDALLQKNTVDEKVMLLTQQECFLDTIPPSAENNVFLKQLMTGATIWLPITTASFCLAEATPGDEEEAWMVLPCEERQIQLVSKKVTLKYPSMACYYIRFFLFPCCSCL